MCSHRCFCCFRPGIRVHSVLFLWTDPWKKCKRDASFFPERNFHGKKCSADFVADQYADRDLACLWFHCLYRILCFCHLYSFRDAAGVFSSVLSDLLPYGNLLWKCRHHRRDLYDYGGQYGDSGLSYRWCHPGRDFFRGPVFSCFHQCTSCQRADENRSFFQYPEYDTQCSGSLYTELCSVWNSWFFRPYRICCGYYQKFAAGLLCVLAVDASSCCNRAGTFPSSCGCKKDHCHQRTGGNGHCGFGTALSGFGTSCFMFFGIFSF